LRPLFHLFEFAYPDGDLFRDCSGALARRLKEVFPGLQTKASQIDQIDMTLPDGSLALFYGTAVAQIQSLSGDSEKFDEDVVSFLNEVSEILELHTLREFRYIYVIGSPCSSSAEAYQLMWPLISEENQRRFQSMDPKPVYKSFQAEFEVGGVNCLTKICVMNLGTEGLDGKRSEGTTPHITVHMTFQGFAPIASEDFDAKHLMQHLREAPSAEVVAKLTPHLKDL
jgi:hypothetical protein